MKLVIRADDFGYSKSVNDGILEAVQSGLIRAIGVMPGLPYVKYRIDELKELDIELGLHSNICVGKPVLEPEQVPSLVDEQGVLFSSKVYRYTSASFIEIEDVKKEIRAQYNLFIEIIGRKPSYIDVHALKDPILLQGAKEVAEECGCIYVDMPKEVTNININGVDVDIRISKTEYSKTLESIKEMVKKPYGAMVFHPGYVDDVLRASSSLTDRRVNEIQILLNPSFKEVLEDNDIELIRFGEIYGEM